MNGRAISPVPPFGGGDLTDLGVLDLTDPLPPADAPFQYEVIRQLADSVRSMTTSLARMQEQMTSVSERLIRIESNRVHDDVARLQAEIVAERARVDALMRDKDRRDGAIGAAEWLRQAAPWAAIVATLAAVGTWLQST